MVFNCLKQLSGGVFHFVVGRAANFNLLNIWFHVSIVKGSEKGVVVGFLAWGVCNEICYGGIRLLAVLSSFIPLLFQIGGNTGYA